MKRISFALLMGSVWIFSGCSQTVDPEITFKPPRYVEELPAKEEDDGFAQLGSLYNQGKSPLFSDRKAMSVNDLVTVVIRENASATSSSQKSTNRNSNMDLGGVTFGYRGDNGDIDGNVLDLMGNANKFMGIGANLASSDDFTGQGSQQKQATFTTTVSARVIKILNNGNYFIDGSREILIDGQKQNIRVSGVIRPEDISSTNSIDSQYIADAKILYETQGDLRRTTEKRWGTKLIDAVWPF